MCAKADYIAKLGLEVTAPAGKSGRGSNRSPFQVAADFAADGDEADLAIWWMYSKGMFGAKMLTWTRGLRHAAGLNVKKTDEDIVEGESAEELTVSRIPGAEWDAFRDVPGMKLALLVAAETEGEPAIRAIRAHPMPRRRQ